MMSAGHKQQNIVLQGRQGFGHAVFVAALATNPSPRACRPQSRRSIPRGFFPWFCYGWSLLSACGHRKGAAVLNKTAAHGRMD